MTINCKSASSHDEAIFVSKSGSDTTGDGSLDSPYQSIQHAINNIDSTCQICVREGTYRECNIQVAQSGTESKKLTVINFPGENVLVDSSADLGPWAIANAALDIYCSNATVPDENWCGSWFDGECWQSLVYYRDKASFESQVYTVDTGPRYVGPGMFYENGQICVRTTPVPQSVMECGTTSTLFNPNDVPFRISTCQQTFAHIGSHIEINGIDTAGACIGHRVEGSTNDVCILNSDIANNAIGVLINPGATDVVVNNNEFSATFPEWLAWTDLKGGDGQSRPADHWTQRVAGVNADGVTNLTVTNNNYKRALDAGVWGGITNGDFSYNSGLVLDDGIQLGSDSVNVEIHDNTMFGAGPSHNDEVDSIAPGTTYIYKNKITCVDFLWGKDDPNNILRASYTGCASTIAFSSHTGADLVSGDPWKIYNNTIECATEDKSRAMGYQLWQGINTTGVDHEVYNNIFIVTDNGYHDADIDTSVAGQKYENNSYIGGLFREDVQPGTVDFATLADWQSSAFATSTGWDQTSTDTLGGPVTTIPASWPCSAQINSAGVRGA